MDKIRFIEYLDVNGELEKIICLGHVNLDVFELQAITEFKKHPVKIRHSYRVFKRIESKKINGRKVGGFNTYLECDDRTYNAELITTGYFK